MGIVHASRHRSSTEFGPDVVLPEEHPRAHDTIHGGYGHGEACQFCTQPIEPSQIEFEVETERTGRGETLLFHFSCYGQWRKAIDSL